MGKSRTNKYGYTREQELRHEIQQLKRENGQLRKRIARIDLDRYDTIKDLIQEHYQEDKAEEGKEILENLKKKWACHSCDGYLEIFIHNRGNETYYWRVCSNAPFCTNRTKSQKYSPEVKGIIRKDKNDENI